MNNEVPGQREVAAAKVPIFLILLAAFIAFGTCLGASFHLDDYTLFSDPAVTSSSGWWYVWRPLQTRPLTYFTFWLNYQFGGDNAIGYHAVNLVLHLLAVRLLYGILARHFDQKTALIATALFALHPIQTEAVVYVFARGTLLATVFCLLSMRSWLDGRYWSAVGWFSLALLGKEECVTFPLFLLLLRRAFLPAAGMLCLSLAAGVRVLLALKLLHVSGAGAGAGISPLDYFSTQGTVILRYFRLLLVPYGFTFDSDIPVVRDWLAWLAWLAIFGTAVFLWKKYRHGRWFAAGLLLLVPSSTIFPAQDPRCRPAYILAYDRFRNASRAVLEARRFPYDPGSNSCGLDRHLLPSHSGLVQRADALERCGRGGTTKASTSHPVITRFRHGSSPANPRRCTGHCAQ
jgi:hypothetical protein